MCSCAYTCVRTHTRVVNLGIPILEIQEYYGVMVVRHCNSRKILIYSQDKIFKESSIYYLVDFQINFVIPYPQGILSRLFIGHCPNKFRRPNFRDWIVYLPPKPNNHLSYHTLFTGRTGTSRLLVYHVLKVLKATPCCYLPTRI